ncbi:MAG TPA: CHAT domain-containing protein [Candidatus Xenobia bacterium]|nr:CHAT domain-containing protein [Candidatus Xenobia bacterium]
MEHARQVYSQEGPLAAVPLYEEALAGYRQLGDRLGEAIVLGYLGNCHKHAGDYDKALELLLEALAIKESLKATVETGKTLNHLGLLYWEMGNYDKALERFGQALAKAEEAKDTKLRAALLNNLSLVYDEQGDYRKSLEQYERALALHREQGDLEGEAYTLGNIGGVYYTLGEFRQAISYHAQAYALSRKLNLKPSQSQDLGNMALSHLELDEIPEAERLFREALTLARQAGLKKDEADWLRGLGGAQLRRGEYSDALASYRAAAEVYQKSEMKRELAEAHSFLADLYLRLGALPSSRRELEQALALATSIGYRRGVVASLSSTGELAQRSGQSEEALSHFHRAYDEALQLDDKTQQVLLLVRLGRAELERERYARAEEHLAAALEIARRQELRSHAALALLGQAEVRRRRDQPEQSLPLYQEGLELATVVSNRELIWRVHHGRGRALEALNRPQDALTAYQAAVTVIEALRGSIREEAFRAGFMEDKYEVYVDLVRLLLQLGRTEEAFLYVERSRARAYLDLLGNGSIRFSGGKGLAEEEQNLRRRIDQLQQLLEREQQRPQPELRGSALETFRSELSEAQRQYSLLLAQLRVADPEFESFVAVKPLGASEVQSLLGEGEVLLEYFLARDHLTIFLLTRDKVVHFDQPVNERDVRAKVDLFRDRLRPGLPGADWQGPAASLRELLLGPVENSGHLEKSILLYIVPHGVLHYLPFSALWRPVGSGGEFLVEKHLIAYLPSASTLRFCQQKADRQRGALLAMAPAISRLRFAREEAKAVDELFAGEGLLAVGREATEELCKGRCGEYGVLHFATHGHLNKLNPLFSRIDLEPSRDSDGRLEVYEIMGLRLHADLATLSACNTALGSGHFGQLPAGEDWVGLTRAFIYAGTPTVLASLWEVDDRSTTELMKAFYRHWGRTDGKAEALALAQRELLGKSSGGTYSNPYYWAGFVLVGDAH